MIKNRVVPVLWGTKHRELTYIKDYFKDPEQESAWINSGHQPEALCVDENLYIVEIGGFAPGTYLPMHVDRFEHYSKANNIQDLSSIVRYVLFLEDSSVGHMLQIGHTVYYHWPAGLCVGWNHSTPHMAANLGGQDRYTLQITGTKV